MQLDETMLCWVAGSIVKITTCSSSTITTHQLSMTRPSPPQLVNKSETLTARNCWAEVRSSPR